MARKTIMDKVIYSGRELDLMTDVELSNIFKDHLVKFNGKTGRVVKFLAAEQWSDSKRTVCGFVINDYEVPITDDMEITLVK